MKKYNIKAIPTMYNGVQYRSRLEAKWAVFFDFMNWEFSYEPYDLDKWSPDFKLKTSVGTKFLVEVKPEEFTDKHLRIKLGESTKYSQNILILGDSPFQGNFNNCIGLCSVKGKTKNYLLEQDFEFCSSVILNLHGQGYNIINLCECEEHTLMQSKKAVDFTKNLWKKASNTVQFLKPKK